jgi:hypothetical protein
VPQQADVVVRMDPATVPLETDAGPPLTVVRGLRQPGSPEREWRGWGRWPQQRYRGRLIAATCDAQTTPRARSRRRRTAQQAGRTITAPPLRGAGWLVLIPTLEATTGSAADGLYVYRARWPVELGLKKNDATAAAQPDTQQASHAWGSDAPGAPDGLGVA